MKMVHVNDDTGEWLDECNEKCFHQKGKLKDAENK